MEKLTKVKKRSDKENVTCKDFLGVMSDDAEYDRREQIEPYGARDGFPFFFDQRTWWLRRPKSVR